MGKEDSISPCWPICIIQRCSHERLFIWKWYFIYLYLTVSIWLHLVTYKIQSGGEVGFLHRDVLVDRKHSLRIWVIGLNRL